MSYFAELNQYEDNKDLSPTSSLGSSPSSGTKPNANSLLDEKNGKGNGSKQRNGRRAARACKSCHSLKVKCTPADENNPNGPCMRCLNSKRKCEIDPNQTRKRRKKAEIQESNNNLVNVMQEKTITKLQDEVNSLKRQLGQRQEDGVDPVSPTPSVFLEKELLALRDFSTSKLSVLTSTLKDTADRRDSLLRGFESIDIIKNGLITIDEARERLELYKTRLNSPYTLVDIPFHATVEELSANQPYLFLAIMSVTNTVYTKPIDKNVALSIDNAAIRAIVLEVLVAGSKSVELIKTLLLLCLWYNTPELFKNRRNHLLNTLSVSLLHDLGIVGRPLTDSDDDTTAITVNDEHYSKSDYQRLIMTLYFSTVCICLTLRRTIYVKWTPLVEECCSVLEKSQSPGDVRIGLFLRLSNQLEKIYILVHLVDFSDRKPTFSKYIIRDVQNKLNNIKAKIPKGEHSFLGYYYTVEAYLYEPIFGQIIPGDVQDLSEFALNTDSVKNINYCTTSCLKALEEFNKMTTDDVATLPLFYASRIIYVVGILLKLRYLVISVPSLLDDLVPQSLILTIQRLTNLFDQSSTLHPVNHILKKTRLVLQLFIQAYASQIQDLYKKESDKLQNDRTDIERLSKIFKRNGSGHLLNAESNDSYQSQVPLDILSYAASFRKGFPNDQNIPDHRLSQSVPQAQGQSLANQFPHTYSSSDLNSSDRMNNINSQYNQNINANPIPQSAVNNLGSLLNDNSIRTNAGFNQPPNDINIDNSNTNDANINTSSGMVNLDQLENFYDEFWSDLINTDSDKFNFGNYSNNTAPLYDEVFFMP
ncbi:uncharacterized protein AC631_03494 [Debaryomyces fabryi]|uniref:Zn(2)-C6 fungal-type domain-containing protein n=1 Tax=Debaryomyces fabryi TaxID=58627 RepID=A0A0V1PWR8_9ASCO|nr:uncharacterized protein AC631_03494 [Debaryomyces fabryi]KSA00724.1 hypothetical protein AC631_03494 [Debaryomyces fabryi]CUM47111.1 unnamed protein product [Debaryomyces fabryi]